MRKVAFYIDGFNLYHALLNLGVARYKWLDLFRLSEHFIHPKEEVVEAVFYFSAVAYHLESETVSRHKAYIHALESKGVTFVEGKFKKKQIKYKNKHVGLVLNKHEEKETDVNIAIHLLKDALQNKYDRYVLVTNDTDITGAVRMAKQENPSAQIKVLTPPTYYTHGDLLAASRQKKPTIISTEQIGRSLLEEEITLQNGKKIRMPEKYVLK